MIGLPGPAHVILPVYNRREVTLRCLRRLHALGVDTWTRLVVADDGSTDGTGAAIHAEFPAVTLLRGNGNLFWTGAIVLGMRHAMAEGTACCVWLNDDSHPVPGAIERIVQYAILHRCIAAGLGQFVGSDRANNPLVFHHFRKEKWGLRPFHAVPDAEGWISVDACRGNLVAIPRSVVEVIGYPDAANLPQYMGDSDYTLRATDAGFRVMVDPRAVVEEHEHSGDWDEPWLTTHRSLRQIWKRFALKQASIYWRANWVYSLRHWHFRGLLLFLAPYCRLAFICALRFVVPRIWLARLRRREMR